jgi:hypothetical protein
MDDTEKRRLMWALEDWRKQLLDRGRIDQAEKREAFYRHLREIGGSIAS